MTTKLPAETYLPLWEQAYAEEIGILIQIANERDKVKLVQALGIARQNVRETGDNRFDSLIIFQPKVDVIFIAHKTVPLDFL